MSKNTGGPAFPAMVADPSGYGEGFFIGGGPDGGRQFLNTFPGMTLRDFWQGQATAAWITALAARYAEPGYNDKDAALEASQLGGLTADFMLAERSKE